jgi:hypothetical protein
MNKNISDTNHILNIEEYKEICYQIFDIWFKNHPEKLF